MSLITTRSRYGLRFLIDLAEHGESELLDLGSIAARQEIPEYYLSKLIIPLKSAGLIRSERGARGGFSLARPASEITVLTVVEVLEGRTSLLECTANPATCSRSGECRTLPVWTGLDKVVRDYLAGMTVASVAKLSLDFSI